jgi:flagellum-specific peptidoglycan hydrolase FlgJ
MKIILVLLAGIALGQSGVADSASRATEKTTTRIAFERRIRNEISTVDLGGINPDYVLSVAVHESGFGTGRIFRLTYNLFSLTVDPKVSRCVSITRWGCYQKFSTTQESILAFLQRIRSQARYRRFVPINSTHWRFFSGLQRAGYATDRQYAIKLDRIYHDICKRSNQCENLVDDPYNRTVSQRVHK